MVSHSSVGLNKTTYQFVFGSGTTHLDVLGPISYKND